MIKTSIVIYGTVSWTEIDETFRTNIDYKTMSTINLLINNSCVQNDYEPLRTKRSQLYGPQWRRSLLEWRRVLRNRHQLMESKARSWIQHEICRFSFCGWRELACLVESNKSSYRHGRSSCHAQCCCFSQESCDQKNLDWIHLGSRIWWWLMR